MVREVNILISLSYHHVPSIYLYCSFIIIEEEVEEVVVIVVVVVVVTVVVVVVVEEEEEDKGKVSLLASTIILTK